MTLILSGTDGLSDIDGSAATPAIRGTDTNTGIFFPAADTIAFSEGGTESMRIDSSGNVGIGTSSPEVKLDVAGDILINNNSYLYGENSIGGNSKLIGRASDDTLYVGDSAYNNPTIIQAGNNYIGFVANGSERARIDSSGNLLVNQTSQIGAEKTGISFDRTSQWGLAIKNTSSTSPSNATYVSFYYTSTNTGSINSTGTTTSYGTTSDYRLKENVAPMTGALATVAQLNPVTYTWKVDGSNGQGFIAHELQAVVPECVTGEKDAVDAEGNPVYQGIDTSFLVATLTAAIQEQQALIQSLTARIEALEGK